jgi:hypothetical protein
MLEYQRNLIRDRLKPFHERSLGDDGPSSAALIRVAGLLISHLGFSFCLTCLFLAMRGVMRLGGYVASGGPYVIAHPAPGWTWLVPTSIVAGAFFIILNALTGRAVGGINLHALVWPAAFLSLGWNFLEFSIRPPAGAHAPIWGWLICGILFVFMGGIPALGYLNLFVRSLRRRVIEAGSLGSPAAGDGFGGTARTGLLLVQLAVLALGVGLSIMFFGSL